jgi:hypothetical protein
VGDLFEGLLQAGAVLVEQPAVVVTAQAVLFQDAVRHVGAAVRAVRVDEAVGAGLVLVQHQVLTHEADGLHRVVVQLSLRGDGHPVAAQEFTHKGTGAGLHQLNVLLLAQHARASTGA